MEAENAAYSLSIQLVALMPSKLVYQLWRETQDPLVVCLIVSLQVHDPLEPHVKPDGAFRTRTLRT